MGKPVVIHNRTFTTISKVAYVHSREFVNVKMFTPTNHDLLPKVAAVIAPMKTDFSGHSPF